MGHATFPVTKSGQKFTISTFSAPFKAELTVYTVVKKKVQPVKKPTPKPLPVLYKGKVTASNLTVRQSSSTKAKKIGTLKKNSTVEVVGSSKGWYKVKFGKGYGYVSSKYVKKVVTTKASKEKIILKGKVTASTLNVRNSESTKGKVIGKLEKNNLVEVVQKSSKGWYKVKYGKGYGWISQKYVKKT